MSNVDVSVTLFFNQFVQRSWSFDSIMVFLASSNLTKGYMALPLIWWGWFRKDVTDRQRAILATILVACILAVGMSQLAQYKPISIRPWFTEELQLRHAAGLKEVNYAGWSSFPSDHATFFFAIATGLLFVSRPLGILALAHALMIVSFPRVYLGLHYLSDIIGGAVLGGGVTYLFCSNDTVLQYVGRLTSQWERAMPGVFYAAMFILTTQMTYLFYDAHEGAKFMYELIHGVGSKLLQ